MSLRAPEAADKSKLQLISVFGCWTSGNSPGECSGPVVLPKSPGYAFSAKEEGNVAAWFKSWHVRVTPERSRVCVCDAAQCNPLTTSPMGLTLWVRCAWFCGPGVTLV